MRGIAFLFLVSSMALGQSVVDAARAARQQQQQAPGAKIYTNDDLGRASEARDEPLRPSVPLEAGVRPDANARQVSERILEQRKRVLRLETHLTRLQVIAAEREKLETPPPYSVALCHQQPERCEGRRAFAQDLERTPEQLDAARAKLQDMQDAARKQGLPESVWDPDLPHN